MSTFEELSQEDQEMLTEELEMIAATSGWLDKVTNLYTMARIAGWDDKGAGAVVMQKLKRGE
jgi:hypothetical protein